MKPYSQLTPQGKARRHRETARLALQQYGIADATISQLAVDTNFVYRVKTAEGAQFALRVHRQTEEGRNFHRLVDTDVECWWVDLLSTDGVPVAGVVKNRDGQAITAVESRPSVPGRQHCVLFEWLKGSEPDEDEPWFWTELGRTAAELHKHSAELVLPTWAEPRRWDSVFPYEAPQLWDSQFDDVITADQRAVVEKGLAVLDPLLVALYKGGDPAPNRSAARLIHGDLHDGNVMSYRRQLSAFDFEDAILGHPEHDLAVALYGPYYNRPDFDEVVTAMRHGYEQVAPWPIDDINDLRPLFAARALGLVNFCVTFGSEYADFIGTLSGRVADFVARPDGSPKR